jgi:tRNA(Ile)-lysidine synthase
MTREDRRAVAAWTRRVRVAWRALAGGAGDDDSSRATLLAVSGGADSVALALALATLRQTRTVLAYIAHDLRPAELVEDDRLLVSGLARRLGVPFVCEHVSVGVGNPESQARSARYRALAALARANGCPLIATAHHAGDQIETVLMALARGAGPPALLGIRPTRTIEGIGVRLIRPMLTLHPDQARRACLAAGLRWRTDASNADPARARARLRATVTPALLSLYPHLGPNLARSMARSMAQSKARSTASLDATPSPDDQRANQARTSASKRSSSDTSETL